MEIGLETLKQERDLVNERFVLSLFNKCLDNRNYINRQGRYDCYVELNHNEREFSEKVISMLEKEGIRACETNSIDTQTLDSSDCIYMYWGDNPNEAKWNIRWEKYGALYCLGILLGIPISACLIGIIIGMLACLFK